MNFFDKSRTTSAPTSGLSTPNFGTASTALGGNQPAAPSSLYPSGFSRQRPASPIKANQNVQDAANVQSTIQPTSTLPSFGSRLAATNPTIPTTNLTTNLPNTNLTTNAPTAFGGFGTARPAAQTQLFPPSMVANANAPATTAGQLLLTQTNPTTLQTNEARPNDPSNVLNQYQNMPSGSNIATFGTAASTATTSQLTEDGINAFREYQKNKGRKMLDIYIKCLKSPNVFNDRRDEVLKDLNFLNAAYGVGKGYYSASEPPIEFDQSNPFCRFKHVFYREKVHHSDEEGLVCVRVAIEPVYLRKQTDHYLGVISAAVGMAGLNYHSFFVDNLENHSKLIFYATQLDKMGRKRRLNSLDLDSLFTEEVKNKLNTVHKISYIGLYADIPQDLLEYYKETPDKGINKEVWENAWSAEYNPDVDNYVPFVVTGFNGLVFIYNEIKRRIDTVYNRIKEITLDMDKQYQFVADKRKYNLQIDYNVNYMLYKKMYRVYSLRELIKRRQLGPTNTIERIVSERTGRLESVIRLMDESFKPVLDELMQHVNNGVFTFKGYKIVKVDAERMEKFYLKYKNANNEIKKRFMEVITDFDKYERVIEFLLTRDDYNKFT